MISAYERVQAARKKGRPTTMFYIEHMFTDFLEMHGDRRFSDDSAMVAGVAHFMGTPVTVIGIEKGTDTKEKIRRNFGSVHPEGYRKAKRQMELAEKFHRPVICFIDTSGAFCGIGAEERGQGLAIAENLMTMMGLRVPLISILIGEGGSGGALALGVADRVWMLENAVYSVISPEGAASIVWKDANMAPQASEALHLTASDLLEYGIIDRIFEEENGDFAKVCASLRGALVNEIEILQKLLPDELTKQRYLKYRKIGGDSK